MYKCNVCADLVLFTNPADMTCPVCHSDDCSEVFQCTGCEDYFFDHEFEPNTTLCGVGCYVREFGTW